MKCRVRRLAGFALLALLLPVLPGVRSQGPEKPGPEPKTPPTEAGVILRFHNGSVVQPAVLLESIEIETKLGKLTVPAGELRRIDFGFRLSEEDNKKVEQAMKDLSSSKFQLRDTATKTLLKMGRLAYPFLLEGRKSADLEMSKRVESILKDIRARVAVERLRTRRTDILKTSDSTVAGQITGVVVKVRSDLFGEVKIPIHQLRELRSLAPGGEVVTTVDAAKHGRNTSWMETEFEVSMGSRLDITTTGEVNLDPMNRLGGNFAARAVNADGTNQLVSGEPPVPGIGSPMPGKLLGKIGADGPTFQIGTRYNQVANREGKLYLRIATIEHANNIQASGHFTVRINAEAE
jgi:hypothetical protein